MGKILLVEDDISWVKLHTRFFSTAGSEIQVATSFDSAIAVLHSKQQFDLIVFDLNLASSPGDDPYVWLNALIEGIVSDKMSAPPIIIVTGLDLPKHQVVRAFTEFRAYVYGYFEKSSFDQKEFMSRVKEAISFANNYSLQKPKTSSRLFIIAIMMVLLVLSTFAILLWSVKQISDPQTQQTILQVGGAVIVVVAIFIAVFSQNTKIESVIESISKIWRG